MAMCTVADVRAVVDPKTLTDSDITSIINLTSGDIAIDAGVSSSSTDGTLARACIHASAALVLQKMKFNGELANQRQIGDSMQSNNVNADIAYHQEKAANYITKYNNNTSDFTIVSGRIGIGTVDSED